MNSRVLSSSPEETVSFGRQLGISLRGREIILISGDLGSGKTLLVKGIASALGVEPNEVVSPSYVLMNAYRGRFNLYHFDVYRLGGTIPADCGIDEFLDEGLIIVEWAQYLDPVYSSLDRVVQIRMNVLSDQEREIGIETPLEYIRLP